MKKLFASLLAGALLLAPAFAQQPAPIDGIAVVVDEDVILQSELDRAVANIRAQYAGRTEQLPPPEVLERQVAERLVLLKLQIARANSTGVKVSSQEVEQTINAIAAQNQVSVDQLAAQLARDGTSLPQFRESIRDELLVQRLRQRLAQSQISVSDAEVDAALAAQQGSGMQYHLAHILVAVPEGATPEQIATAQSKIEGVQALIKRGEMDFAAAAVRYSDSPNALEGGDLGWRSSDEIPSAFAEMVRNMSPGQVTEPIRGPSGFQMLQVVESRDASQAAPSMVTQYHASHILIRVDENTGAAEAKAKADTLHARLLGGADFAALAREESQDPSSQARGGDLGWFARDQFGPDFGAEVAKLDDGAISSPFRTQAGWHIVKRVGTRQSDVGDTSQRDQVRETIGRRKLEDEWNRFLREMRGEAFVDFRTVAGAGDSDAGEGADGTRDTSGN
ncbi:peptidylprolyl isomerase [Lysobacter sp. H21R4]|uniref:peptidylprolyl isomerase n=1 Tax=Lysobacter sp. H21R4 TaxID=2781021 RepID=UPI0018887E8E|nr:peptidylprolyl isomerase [Lysobacter sp. H21R4]